MVFEDAQWIDPRSRELLDRTIDRVANLRVLSVITFRPEFQSAWTERSHVSMMVLNRLDHKAGGALIHSMTRDRRLPPELVNEIADRTDGVPLFVEELTKAVLEAGAAGVEHAISIAPHPALATLRPRRRPTFVMPSQSRGSRRRSSGNSAPP
jgi:predicted ATPase